MLFIEALAQTMLVMLGVAIGFAFGFSRLERLVERVHTGIVAQETSSLDDELRDL